MRKHSLLTATVVVLMTALILLSGHRNRNLLPLDDAPQAPAKHVNPLRPSAPRGQLASHISLAERDMTTLAG